MRISVFWLCKTLTKSSLNCACLLVGKHGVEEHLSHAWWMVIVLSELGLASNILAFVLLLLWNMPKGFSNVKSFASSTSSGMSLFFSYNHFPPLPSPVAAHVKISWGTAFPGKLLLFWLIIISRSALPLFSLLHFHLHGAISVFLSTQSVGMSADLSLGYKEATQWCILLWVGMEWEINQDSSQSQAGSERSNVIGHWS